MSKIIVSFTSYPARISTIGKILDSIVRQTILPDKIVLYLSSDEFKNYHDMPDLECYKKYGFEIHWNKENLKSHKKWFYAMQEYPDEIIITIDDDTFYKNTMIEELMAFHKQYPNAVIARRTHCMIYQIDGKIAPYNKWYFRYDKYVGVPRTDLIAVGCQGVLYPPHIFNKEVFNKKVFMENAPYADDLWLKIMELYSGIDTVLSQEACNDPILEEYKETGLYIDQNGNGGNDIQLKRLLDIYNERCGEEELLTDRLFLSGKSMMGEYGNRKKREMCEMVYQYFEIIKNEDEILIYGAGTVAERLYVVFKKLGWLKRIKAFIVEDKGKNVEKLGGIVVSNYMDYLHSSEKIIIGLWNTKQDEIYENLVSQGIDATRIIRLTPLLNKTMEEMLQNNSAYYWEQRYIRGGNSGKGSYNRLAQFKADVINKFVEENAIDSVIEWGCGDGNQLSLAKYPQYVGYDVSEQAIFMCQERYSGDRTKRFMWCGGEGFTNDIKADLAISLDVIYHLIEDDIYQIYMERLFGSSKKYVCIYSSDFDKGYAQHVKCRKFTDYVKDNFKEWDLMEYIPNMYPYEENNPGNTSWSDFYFYKKICV